MREACTSASRASGRYHKSCRDGECMRGMTDGDTMTTNRILSWYNWFSRYYDRGPALWASDLRASLLSRAEGRALELAVGTGANFPHYPRGFFSSPTPDWDSFGSSGGDATEPASVVGVDLSPRMLAMARVKAHSLRLRFTGIVMDAANLGFPDSHFDTVVCTFALCTFPNPIRVLDEIIRVCRRHGRILMVEHSRTERLGWLQDAFAPIARTLWQCDLNRDTLSHLRNAQLRIVSDCCSPSGFVHAIEASSRHTKGNSR